MNTENRIENPQRLAVALFRANSGDHTSWQEVKTCTKKHYHDFAVQLLDQFDIYVKAPSAAPSAAPDADQPLSPGGVSQTAHSDEIAREVQHLGQILAAKHRNYGGSAFQAPQMLPHLPPSAAIAVRMSDKIARLTTLLADGLDEVGESIDDTLLDLAGYAILLRIARRQPAELGDEK